jgi:hypothetical protein
MFKKAFCLVVFYSILFYSFERVLLVRVSDTSSPNLNYHYHHQCRRTQSPAATARDGTMSHLNQHPLKLNPKISSSQNNLPTLRQLSAGVSRCSEVYKSPFSFLILRLRLYVHSTSTSTSASLTVSVCV